MRGGNTRTIQEAARRPLPLGPGQRPDAAFGAYPLRVGGAGVGDGLFGGAVSYRRVSLLRPCGTLNTPSKRVGGLSGRVRTESEPAMPAS